MLKLPKSLADHPHLALLEAYFREGESMLEVEGNTPSVIVSKWALDAALLAALRAVRGTGHLMQGLELIGTTLDREGKGLRAAQAKAAQPSGQRLSRLLLLANDGAPRFYRDASSLLSRNADRVRGVLVDASAAELGKEFTPKGGATKALLIDDKDALGLALSTLADALAKA